MTIQPKSVPDIISDLSAHRDGQWAWSEFKETVRQIIISSGAKQVMEIGGGRFPLFNRDEIGSLEAQYTVNDISKHELELAPPYVSKANFDIASRNRADIPCDQYDFAFSQMVFEHVHDAGQAYSNLHTLLRPGGIGLNFHPVLYSPPFVLNSLLPEFLSRRILRFFFPNRTDDGIPKFPTHYDLCSITPRTFKAIRNCGFSSVEMLPFFGHNYFAPIPGLREADHALQRLAERRNILRLASFAYTIVVK